MAKAEKKLPAKLSGCIEVAIADLVAVERMKNSYVVDMSTYHMPTTLPEGEIRCSVCFAGAVIAQSLGLDPSLDSDPNDFTDYNERRLRALDQARCGDIQSALECLGREMPFGMSDVLDVTPYINNPTQFKKDMKQVVKVLRIFGE